MSVVRPGLRPLSRSALPTIDAASAQCNRSCPQSRPALPNATHVHARDPKPSAPRELAPQARTCSLSCLSWLHPLKSWSLRQTRGGSGRPTLSYSLVRQASDWPLGTGADECDYGLDSQPAKRLGYALQFCGDLTAPWECY